MTPKKKAIELVDKFKPLIMTWDYTNDEIREDECILIDAKKCALIAVDEIISEYDDVLVKCYDNDVMMWQKDQLWWNEVKKEIELL